MIRITQLKLPISYTDSDIKKACAKALSISEADILTASLFRRSIDARHKNDIKYITSADVTLLKDERTVLSRAKNKNAAVTEKFRYIPITPKDPNKRPLIVGMGPAGLFCALTMIQSGIRPIIIERGSSVDDRKKKVEIFRDGGALDTECNVQFGEGGAGAFSDGKLNTGTKDERARKVLIDFVRHGAPEDILCDAKPHIGTDRLIPALKSIRQELIDGGAEIYFDTKLSGIEIKNKAVVGAKIIRSGKEETIACREIVLCIGHSARDTFELLKSLGVLIQPKPFSVGVRIEHLKESIDRSLYGKYHSALPAASYKQSVHLKDGRGVYTFCMCPGGVVIASQSEENTIVTNGMSEYARDKTNSNAALLVSVNPDDIASFEPLKGMYFQRQLERQAFIAGSGGYNAPVQRVGDFLTGEMSTRFGEVIPSYRPGTSFVKLDTILPEFVSDSLKAALPMIDRRLSGFSHPDAILTAVESRSSSPVRITRDETMQSVSLRGLYPCGEGAGYAGGIVSAAVDGIKAAEIIIES